MKEIKLGAMLIVMVGVLGVLIYNFGNFYDRENVLTATPAAVADALTVNHPKGPDEIVWGNRGKKQVIFTFDAGGASTSIDSILATLAKHHVKGTFFVTGKFINQNPDVIRKMAAAGSEIFSHTFTHPHLTTIPDAEIRKELEMTDAAYHVLTGGTLKPYFRPPYGDRDSRVRSVAGSAGYQSVYWTVDARDWQEATGRTAQEVNDRIMNSVEPGAIYLMHVGDKITGVILDDVFTKIEAKGYTLVSLTQGL